MFKPTTWYSAQILLHILSLILNVSVGLAQADVLMQVFLWTLLRGFLQHVVGFHMFWI